MAKEKRKKGAKKKFFDVSIPLTATKVQLYGYDAEDLVGNTVKLDLTKTMRGKNVELKARVKMDGTNLVGELLSLQVLPSYIRKIVRRGTDYVEDSFAAECKDATLRVKPFMITRKRVSRAVRNAIKITARKYIESKAKIRTAIDLFSEIMTNKLQRELSIKIKKIYPLAVCEIRMFEVEAYHPMRDFKPTKEEMAEIIEPAEEETVIEEPQ